MKTLLIVYHTMTGGSQQMADAARRGASAEPEVTVRLLHAADASADDLLAADAYIFVTPENLAAMSGVMKHFFDRTFYPVLDRIIGRHYAVLVCAGSDGTNAVRQIDRVCLGWRLKPACEAIVVCTHAQTPEKILAPKTIGEADLERCEETGATLAAGLSLGIF